MKRIGIIGGLGAAAGAWAAQQLVEEAQRRGACQDDQFPNFVLLSVPFTDTDCTGLTGDIFNQLARAVFELNVLECRIGIIACNTAYVHFPRLQDRFHGKLINIVELACNEAANRGHKKVGVLCSETSKIHGLYRHNLKSQGVEAIEPDDAGQEAVNALIADVMAGQWPRSIKPTVERMALEADNAIIVGCTELSIWADHDDQRTSPVHFICPVKLAVKAALDLLNQ